MWSNPREIQKRQHLDVIFGVAILTDFGARFYQPVAIARARPSRDMGRCCRQSRFCAVVVKVPAFFGFFARFDSCTPTSCSRDFAATAPGFAATRRSPSSRASLGLSLRHDRHRLRDAAWINPQIRNYADALYFTVTALTTTGFGDITLAGSSGGLSRSFVMVFGVTLFLRLVRALLQPLRSASLAPLRIAAARHRCRSLQSLRYTAQHS